MQTLRSPNLNTVMMVEDYLKECSEPISIADLKKGLPKQVMHQTLKVILEYLWESGKIIYGPRGIQWTFSDRLEKIKEKGLEI